VILGLREFAASDADHFHELFGVSLYDGTMRKTICTIGQLAKAAEISTSMVRYRLT